MRQTLRIVAAIAALALAPPLAAQARTVVLVRHAEKAAPSGDPALSAAGEARAAELARVLADWRLDAVIVSQFRRTQLTAAPVAKARGLTPQVVSAGDDVAGHAASVAAAVRALPAGSAALVVGHSNTLGPIVGALGGPNFGDLCDGEYASLFVLDLPPGAPPRLLRATYGAPDPEGAAECTRQMQLR
jgi:broad specificity phosphatase PhoE